MILLTLGFFRMEAINLSQQEKNRLTAKIYGVEYVIIGTESPSHIRRVTAMVDEKMREISAKNPSLDTSRLAVLTAINVVNDYLLLKEKLERPEHELKE
jgi:cell division protein ZapA